MRISSPAGTVEQLFDLVADPGELEDLLAAGEGALTADAREHLAFLRAELAAMGME